MEFPLKTVAIATSDDALAQSLQELVLKSGYTCPGIARSAMEAAGLFQLCKPQILLLDITNREALAPLLPLPQIGLVLVSASTSGAVDQETRELGAEALLFSPWVHAQARAILEAAWHSVQRDHERQVEIESLKDQLETRKLIERAKGILMVERKIGETEAYRLLQKMSQDKRLSMKDVCRAVEQVRALVGEKMRHKTTP